MRLAFCLAAWLVAAPALTLAQSLTGLWDAKLVVSGTEVPFRLELAGEGASVKGWFFNGEDKVPSTSGRFANGSLVLNFDQFASKLEATLKDGVLEGKYAGGRRGGWAFQAKRFTPSPARDGIVPGIAGVWVIANESPKGEHAWRFIVRQSGPEVSAAILRVDGDTGTLTGAYQGDKFVLSHFSGARPNRLEVTPMLDDTLQLSLNGKSMTATRESEARAKGLAAPTDPTKHTGVKDPREPFHFRFPDLSGRVVSESDARFQGKVVLINITGSWCPNCHDEAPFLAELYRKYRDRGLEIVALSFEEAEQLKDPTRLRAFMKEYGIEYTVLVAGEPAEAPEKLPQAVNWNAWPTTFFVGRDGRVRSVHAGFPSRGSGEFYTQAKEEFTALVERLLAESTRTSL
jgi:thiol-disulfide isomerase/thioredoxin